jgi:nucleolar protein 6
MPRCPPSIYFPAEKKFQNFESDKSGSTTTPLNSTAMGSSKKPQDATRQERKAKKRKLEDAVPDLPGDVEDVDVEKAGKKRKRDKDVEAEEINGEDDDREKKERKKEKKRTKKEAEESAGAEVANGDGKGEKKNEKEKKAKSSATIEEPEVEADAEVEAGPKKSKKERKAERKAKEAAEAAKGKDVAPVEESKSKPEQANGAETEGGKKSKKNNRNREKKRKGSAATDGVAVNGDAEKAVEEKDKKDARFICFIGTSPIISTSPGSTYPFCRIQCANHTLAQQATSHSQPTPLQ